MATNHYETLGLEKSATDEEIKKAYRKLSRKYHPDLNSDAGAEDKYKAVNEAHAILGDKEKRSIYDRQGASFGSFSGFGGSGVNYEDLLKNYGKSSGSNSNLDDLTKLMDEINKNYRNNSSSATDDSFGSMFGEFFGNAKNTASSKFGNVFNKNSNTKKSSVDAPTASITVTFEESLVTSTHTVEILGKQRKIRIPAGIRHGQKILLKEVDNAVVTVKVKTSDYFYWKDGNLVARVPVTLKQAFYGGTYSFRLPDGTELTTNLPSHCANRPLRMAGKGAGGADLILRPYIAFSKETTAQDLIEELG